MKGKRLLTTLVLGVGLTMALLWLLSGPGTGLPAVRAADLHVCPSGCAYSSIQAAVDAASGGDVIKVATGTYTGVSARAGVTQVVYISKSITIQGGYTTAFTEPPNPEANPTTLDAQEQGRVLYITGDVSTTVEGLRITGGYVKASGGGIYNKDADLALANTIITNNVSNGDNWPGGLGGGMYVDRGSVVLSEVQVISNSASYKGGGLCVWGDSVTLSGGQISHNTARGPNMWDGGGGMFVLGSATLNGVQVISNTVGNGSNGGGLYLYRSHVTLIGGQIIDNSAAVAGGGVYIWPGTSPGGGVTLSQWQIISNTAYWGGGVYIAFGGVFTVTGASSIAHNSAIDKGGGVYVEDGLATLSRAHIVSNTAGQDGGGILVGGSTANVTLTNSVVTDNRADRLGSGLYVEDGSSRLVHVTIARNLGGDGSGIHVTGSAATVAMTNTIVATHTVGITVTDGNTATLEGVLWYSNTADYGGEGTITVTKAYTGDPAFAADGYHLTLLSEAIDKGVDAGVTTDIDGFRRPCGRAPDLGADEINCLYLPAISKYRN